MLPERKLQQFCIANMNLLTPFKEIISVHYENHTNLNTLSRQTAMLVSFKAGGMYSYHLALKD
jgi:hypothetical protein